MSKRQKTRNVIISGLTAAGKTTHSKILAEKFNLSYISAAEILLNSANLDMNKIPADFWVTSRGLNFVEEVPWTSVDDELTRLEANVDHTVFDCFSLPWIHSKRCMSIWLESSFSSRVMKAIVSHKGEGNLKRSEVETGIKLKDQRARDMLMEKYKIDMFVDRKPFDLIIDISSFIEEPTEKASQISINKADEIITNAVGWFLYGRNEYLKNLKRSINLYSNAIIKCNLNEHLMNVV